MHGSLINGSVPHCLILASGTYTTLVSERWSAILATTSGLFATIALYLSGLTIWSVWTSRSEVPWRDQWIWLQDARDISAHHWHSLWYPYWGHRPVIARVMALAGVRFFSGLNTPMVALILFLQAAHTVLLIWIAWRLFSGVSRPLVLLIAALIVDLNFSALQMENFIWAGQQGYILVWLSSTLAFLLLAVSIQRNRRRAVLLTGCILLAVVSTLSSPGGLSVWPVLVIQAFVLRLSSRIKAILTGAGIAATAIYLHSYDKGPPMGMGFLPAILHPYKSIPVVGMILAGSVTPASIRLAMFLGCITLATGLYAIARVLRYKPPPLVTVAAALALFALLNIAGIVTSRISPNMAESRIQLHQLIIPSRYYTFIAFFWDGLILTSAWLLIRNKREWPQLAVIGAMCLVMTLGSAGWQIGEAANWRGYFREEDIAGAAVIMHVHDDASKSLNEVYGDSCLRFRISDWLKEKHLALFTEHRARLPGRRIKESEIAHEGCPGTEQFATRLKDNVYRVTGWAGQTKDLAFADESHTVIGIARTGLRRPDLKGKLDPSIDLDFAGWQGYLRGMPHQKVTLYSVRKGFCPITDFVLP